MLSKRELDVLNILWNTDKEMTSADIADARKDLTQSTVIAVLRQLTNTCLVEVVGSTRSGTVMSRTYRPTEKSKQVILDNFAAEYSMFRDIITLDELIDRLR